MEPWLRHSSRKGSSQSPGRCLPLRDTWPRTRFSSHCHPAHRHLDPRVHETKGRPSSDQGCARWGLCSLTSSAWSQGAMCLKVPALTNGAHFPSE